MPEEIFTSEAALSIMLRWSNVQTPAVIANLERPVGFPSPRDIPEDEPRELRARFDDHLQTHFELLNLLDLSSNEHHFGVALERLSDQNVQLRENRLTVEMRGVRLLMQPQVQWEPVEVVPNADAGVPNADRLFFKTNGARTLAGASFRQTRSGITGHGQSQLRCRRRPETSLRRPVLVTVWSTCFRPLRPSLRTRRNSIRRAADRYDAS